MSVITIQLATTVLVLNSFGHFLLLLFIRIVRIRTKILMVSRYMPIDLDYKNEERSMCEDG